MQFTFVSGNLALDFTGTVQHRDDARLDLMSTPESLGRWLVAAGVLDALPAVSESALTRAVDLREAIYRSARDQVERSDIALVDTAAATPPPRIGLDPDGTLCRSGDVEAGLSAIARSGCELLGTPLRARIRQCGRDGCTRLFVDTSRGANRRWCDMTVCGNRVKNAAFRARH